MITQKEHLRSLALILLAALAGMVLVVIATAKGPGVGGDATIYLTTAQNLLTGKGLVYPDADGTFRLLPYTPPFYPLVLSFVGLLSSDMLAGARWLNVLLFGATVTLLGWAFYRATGRMWLAALVSGVAAFSPVIVGVEVWAMSESLFLFLGFAGLLLLMDTLARPRWGTWLGAAALCGLAFLTRYIGVAFVGTGALALLIIHHQADDRYTLSLNWKDLRKKLPAAVGFGFLAILPALIWLIVDFAATGTVGSRSGQPAAAYWQRFLEMGPALQQIYLFWLLPDSLIARLPGVVQAALWLVPLAALVVVAVFLVRRAQQHGFASDRSAGKGPATLMALVWGLFIGVFLIALAGAQVFTYPPITLASRMLSPVHLAVILFVFVLLHLTLAAFPAWPRWAAVVVYLACFGWLGMYALRGVMIAREDYRTGIGYMEAIWSESQTLAQLDQLPADLPIVSNETTAITFFTGRPAYALQEIYQDQPQDPFTAYGAGDDAAQAAFREQGAALVLFNHTIYSDFSMYGDRVDERLAALTQGLYPYYQGPDGAIYFFSEQDLPK